MASTKSNSSTLEMAPPVAAPRLFRAAVMDWPKVASHVGASVDPVEGDGGVGSVRQAQRLEFDKCECKTLIEGRGIGVAIESATSQIKMEHAADGGSVVKVESTYKLLPGVEVKDEIGKTKEADGGSVVKVESTFKLLPGVEVKDEIGKTKETDGGSVVKVESTFKLLPGVEVKDEIGKTKETDGGSVVKLESTYKLLPGVEVKDEIAKAKKSVTAVKQKID